MAFLLPAPQLLDIHNCNASEKRFCFLWAWNNYSLAMAVSTKTEAVQVATLLTVIGLRYIYLEQWWR